MKILNYIRVRNFRGFKDISVEDFGDINIIVGRNNTGKSTLLESIYLNVTRGNIDLSNQYPIRFILERRGMIEVFPRIPELKDFFPYIFYNGNFEEDVIIQSNLNNYVLRFTSEIIKDFSQKPYRKYYPPIIKLKIKRERDEFVYMIEDNSGNPPILIFRSKRAIPYEYYYIVFPVLFFRKPSNVIFIDDYQLIKLKTISMKIERYSEINRDKLLEYINKISEEKFSTIEPKIHDVYLIKENGEHIPLNMFGDGFKKMFLFILTFNIKNSLIILEEPENHYHPKFLKEFCKLIIEVCNYNQIL